MTKTFLSTALALAYPFASTALAQDAAPASIAASAPSPDLTEGKRRAAQIVTITGTQPRSLPAEIPTTLHSATAADIERSVNATDSEDALKYFPSLLVRKRYIGDYNHAILSSRASGTGNSARSAVYADGILLSNYLGNGVGGLSFPPRWEMVTPEEIDPRRRDVRTVLGGLPGQLGGRGGRLRDAHAHALRCAREGQL